MIRLGSMTAVAAEELSSPKLGRPSGDESPVKSQAQRHSTDVLFAILIFLSWVALSAIGAYVYLKGDYRVVYYPMDYAGNICGTNVATNTLNVTDYPKIVYVNSLGGGVCVKECPNVTELVDPQTLITYAGVYQGYNASLPANYVNMPNYATAYNSSTNYTCNSFKCPTDPQYSWISLGIRMGTGYAYYAMDTIEIFGHRCIVNPNAKKVLEQQVNIPTGSIVNTKFVNNQYEFWKNLYADLFMAKEFIFGFGFIVSLVIGFLYSSLLRIKWLVHTMVWLSIFCTIAAVFALGTYLLYISKHWASQNPQVYSNNFIQGAKICAYVIFGIGALLVFLIIYLRKEIHLAMALIKTAAASIGSMPLIVFFPILQSVCLIAFVVAWIFYAVNLASLGKIVPKQLPLGAVVTVRTFQFDKLCWELAWYILFCLFWTTTFIGAMGQLIVAMCAARWYFTRDKSKIHSGAIFANMWTVLRYHMGTAAFGSLIIAIILLLRAIVMYFQRKAKQLNSTLAGILLCCCQCCLWCAQKCMEFISKNAYIYTSMFGTPFCKSAREAFSLIVRNAARVGTLSYVSVMVVFVGRLFISTTTAAASWVIMQHYLGSKLYSLAGPTVIIFLIAYHVGDMFMQVFNMTASAILHCFVADEEMFDSAEQYATDELREFIDKNEAKARKVLKVEG